MGANNSKNITLLSDQELITRYKYSHDTIYIGELFKRYSHIVFGIALKYLKAPDRSKDAVMDIFEASIGHLKKYEVQNFYSWLYTVSKNHCLMELRQTQYELLNSDDLINKLEGIVENDHGVHLDKEVKLRKLHAGIKRLDSQQRVCIEMHYLKQIRYKDIAEQTGYSDKQVKSFIQNGKRNLKIYMTS